MAVKERAVSHKDGHFMRRLLVVDIVAVINL